MSAPVPRPRSNAAEGKKPIPAPRRLVSNNQKSTPPVESSSSTAEENTNTFSRRVKSIGTASKQIVGDIGGIFEETRQSVRKIKRHLSFSQSDHNVVGQPPSDGRPTEPVNDIFHKIKFDSPLTPPNSIYNNVGSDVISSSESLHLPPPTHPPPPLPDESVYDAPVSVASSSNSSRSNVPPYKPDIYESVFPVYPYNSDSGSCIDMTERTISNRLSLATTRSWKFYDTVSSEHIYNNVNLAPMVPTPIVPSGQVNNSKNAVDVNSIISERSSVEYDQNLLYENQDIIKPPPQNLNPKPPGSVIMQFDPLFNSTNSDDGSKNEKLLEYLQGNLYGNISNTYTLDDYSISNDSEGDDFITPPSPPVRFDSLPDEDSLPPSTPTGSRANWFVGSEVAAPVVTRSFSWVTLKESIRNPKKKNFVDRPLLATTPNVMRKGMLYKVQNGPVEDLFGEYSARWCVLENHHFNCYSDNTCANLKESFPFTGILSVQMLLSSKYKYKYDNDDLHCFELSIGGKVRSHIYGSRSTSERRIWMQCLGESLTSSFSIKIISDFTRMGWAYAREGVSGRWSGAWVVLKERDFYYVIGNQVIKSMDLRKARCIVLQAFQDSDNNPHTHDKGPNIVIDCPGMVLYLRTWTTRETKIWCHMIKVAAHNNGASLNQQQLTKDNIPVIVEKCINFIYVYGSMSEGIYRKPGSGSNVSDILMKFMKDAFSAELTSEAYSEYEVATALKRFFRNLPEPLLGKQNRKYLHQVSLQNDRNEKVRMYKASLDELPRITFNTVRKIIKHLHFISTQSAKNRMNIDNLASIWGSTLLHNEGAESVPVGEEHLAGSTNNNNEPHQLDAKVLSQLISMYRYIFPEDPEDLKKEKYMLQVLQSHAQSSQNHFNRKNAGDLRVWICERNKEGKQHNVEIGPNRTAYDVCEQLCEHMNLPAHELLLEEVVLNDRLWRPIHHAEKVLDVVLRWGYWDEADRKENYLILSPVSKYSEIFQRDSAIPEACELKFADTKSKTCKSYLFEFAQATLTCLKDKSKKERLYSWRIEDIVWYFGHESKRNNSHYNLSITFIETKQHPKRTKHSPYFGHVLVWNEKATRNQWLRTMLIARYANNLLPKPKLIMV